MPSNHFGAIVRWREQLDALGLGLEDVKQSATISTMLFGCQTWLEHNAAEASSAEVEQIERIKAELEAWLGEHQTHPLAGR